MAHEIPESDCFSEEWSAGQQTALHVLHTLAPSCGYDGRKLARMCNVSQRHLQRVFSARFARTPQAWLNERRLHTAWQMLQTAGSVKEVAYSLGFRRPSQFSRDFRRLFGLTPSQACSRAGGAQLGVAAISSQNLAGLMRSERQRAQRLGEVKRSLELNSNPHSRHAAGT